MPTISQEVLAKRIEGMSNKIAVSPKRREGDQRHDEEMQEIIGTPPAWLLRWGTTVFFTVLVVSLALTELITYPDIVKTQLKIRSVNSPQPVIMKVGGKLVKLSVQNDQQVKAGQVLAKIESVAGNDSLIAQKAGKVAYAGIIHENQEFIQNQDMFYITVDDNNFFGEMVIAQSSVGKVKAGQEVLIKLESYPYQEYGILHGTIKYITGGTSKDPVYLAEVDLKTKNLTDMHKPLQLKQGMIADAEIITQKSSLFKRLAGNMLKNINH